MKTSTDRKTDMTVGKPWKIILAFMIPVCLGNIFQNLYSIVDSIIVGRLLGTEAFAAVGVTSAQGFIVTGWINGMTSGFSMVFAQEYGAKRENRLRHFLMMAIYLCVGMCILMTAGLLASNRFVLQIMKTPEDIFALTESYIRVIYGGLFTSIAYNLLAGLLRACGDSKTPLKLLVISSVLNIFLDIVCIRWLSMGVEGTAYATVISHGAAAVLCLLHIKKHYPLLKGIRAEKRIKWKSMAALLKIGFLMALLFSVTGFSAMIVQWAINGFGTLYITAISTVEKIQGVIGQPMVALGTALGTYTGQNYGAGKLDRIKQGVRIGDLICVVIGAVSTAFILLFGRALVPLFLKEDVAQIQGIAQQYFVVVAGFYLPLSLIYVYRNALQGLGEGIVPFLGGVFELFARIIAIGLLVKPLGFYGVILSDPLAWVFALIPLVPYYYYRMKKIENGQN